MQICKVDFAIFSQKATKKRPFGRFFHSFIHSLTHSFIHSFIHSLPMPPGPVEEDIKTHDCHYTGNDVP